MKKSMITMGLFLALTACGPLESTSMHSSPAPRAIQTLESPAQETESKIIGTNELVKVKRDGSNVDANLRPYLDAFGIIDLGGGVCSGTHIGNGYVLTAGHCITKSTFAVKMNQECSSIQILWGYRGSPETGSLKPGVTMVSTCQEMVFAEFSQERDFAILKMDKAPSTFIPLSRMNARMSQGTRLTIFGYPHGRPLEWSTYCRSISLPYSMTQFGHECDTEPGNSGSTILSINESGKPVVVGIHDAGSSMMNIGTHLFDAITTLKSQAKFNLITATSSL